MELRAHIHISSLHRQLKASFFQHSSGLEQHPVLDVPLPTMAHLGDDSQVVNAPDAHRMENSDATSESQPGLAAP